MDHNSFSIISSLFKVRTMTLWAQYYLSYIPSHPMGSIRGADEVCCPIKRLPPVSAVFTTILFEGAGITVDRVVADKLFSGIGNKITAENARASPRPHEKTDNEH